MKMEVTKKNKRWKAQKRKFIISGFSAHNGHLDNIETTGITFLPHNVAA